MDANVSTAGIICPMHGLPAIWRDKWGYWHCSRCLDIIADNYRILFDAADRPTKARLIKR